MKLLARRKLLRHLFLFVKLNMDPLVMEDILFFNFHLVYSSLWRHISYFCTNSSNVVKLSVKWICWQEESY